MWRPRPAWREELRQRSKRVGGPLSHPSPVSDPEHEGRLSGPRLPDRGQLERGPQSQAREWRKGWGSWRSSLCPGVPEARAAQRDTRPPVCTENPQWLLLGSWACLLLMSPRRQTVVSSQDPQESRVTLSGLPPKASQFWVLPCPYSLSGHPGPNVGKGPCLESRYGAPLTAGPGPLGVSETRKAPGDQGGHVPVQTPPNWKEGGPSARPSLRHPDPRPREPGTRWFVQSRPTGERAWWAPRAHPCQAQAGERTRPHKAWPWPGVLLHEPVKGPVSSEQLGNSRVFSSRPRVTRTRTSVALRVIQTRSHSTRAA